MQPTFGSKEKEQPTWWLPTFFLSFSNIILSQEKINNLPFIYLQNIIFAAEK